MILIRANTERQIPVIRATLVSAPLASASKYVYAMRNPCYHVTVKFKKDS